jgi:hypothetical protein
MIDCAPQTLQSGLARFIRCTGKASLDDAIDDP